MLPWKRFIDSLLEAPKGFPHFISVACCIAFNWCSIFFRSKHATNPIYGGRTNKRLMSKAVAAFLSLSNFDAFSYRAVKPHAFCTWFIQTWKYFKYFFSYFVHKMWWVILFMENSQLSSYGIWSMEIIMDTPRPVV